MKKGVVFLSVLSLVLIGASKAWCQDEVFVDLSVLGEVGANDGAYYAQPAVEEYGYDTTNAQIKQGSVSSILNLPPLEPKFPIVKPKPKVAKKRVAPVLKPKKVEPKVEVKAELIEVNVEVVPEPVEPKEIVEVKIEDIIVDEPLEDDIELNDVADKDDDADFSSNQEVDSVEVEEIVVEIEENTVEASSSSVDEILEPLNDINSISDEKANDVQDENIDVSLKEDISDSQEDEGLSPKASDVKQDITSSNLVAFEEELVALTDENKDKILGIIASFENPVQNKIGIFSYNLDNGEDAFKRKRQSLSRATEVRSFLISKGYKNYNIKVVNVDETSAKINSVEIVEVK